MILDPERLALFAGASLLLLVTPGPAVLYIVAQAAQHGTRAGLVSALGLTTGGAVHVAAAAAGVSALLAASAPAFHALRLAGAAYLVWLGVRTLVRRPSSPGMSSNEDAAVDSASGLARTWRRGIVVNVLNPKAAVFFVAFLPQFVDPSRGATSLQLLLLGLLFLLLGMATDALYAVAAGRAARRLRSDRWRAALTRWVPGSVYVALGVAAAAAGRAAR